MRQIITAIVFWALTMQPAAAAGHATERQAAAVLADFAAAYSLWTAETRCRALRDDDRALFGATIAEDQRLLDTVFGAGAVDAAARAGAHTTAALSGCRDAAENAQIGVSLAQDVAREVKSLPRGFRANAPG